MKGTFDAKPLDEIKEFLEDRGGDFIEWLEEVWEKIEKNPRKNIPLIIISPIIIYAMAEALLPLSIFAVIGYVVACLYGFSNILDNPNRMLLWGVGYAIGAAITPIIFSSVWPEIQKGTSISIFS